MRTRTFFLKISYPILLLFGAANTLYCQQSVIRGEASIINSKYETKARQYVSNAQVEEDFGRAQPVTTDATGAFYIELVKVNEKESITFTIRKEGLEVVNTDALNAVAGQKEVVKVYMATPQKIAEYKKQYYQIGKTAAEKKLEEKLKKLQMERQTLVANKNADQKRVSDLEAKLGELEAQRAKIDEAARELARRYAPINLDDASPLYRDAFSFFQKGELDKALEVLQRANLEGQAQYILDERLKINDLKQEAALRDSIQKQRTTDVLSALNLKADLHKNRFEFDSVLVCFEWMLALDSTHYSNTFAFAHFLADQNKDKRAIQLYEKCLTWATMSKQRAVLLNNLGILYEKNNRMADAEKAYAESLSGYRILAAQRPDVFLPDVAMILHNLGGFYKLNQKTPNAENAYLEALDIRRELAEKNPETLLPDLSSTLNNLGIFYSDSKRMAEAEKMYGEALSIRRKLASDNPDVFLPNLANTLSNLGNYYRKTQKMPEAENAYNEALNILLKLSKKKPDAYLPAVASVFNNLGLCHIANKKMPEAEIAYREALKIRRKLAEQNPDAFGPDLAVILDNLGRFFNDVNRYSEALPFFKESVQIRENAVQAGQTHFKRKLIEESGLLSWWAIQGKDYALAEQAAKRCLALDETQIWVWVNIGHARYLSGKETEALDAWLHLKGKSEDGVPFSQFLEDDWQTLEETAIAPPRRFDAARTWLRETWDK